LRAIYARIESGYREQIASGALRAGERLPTEAQIAHDMGTCRGTVQRAMQRLVEAGLVERSRGRGTFVAQKSLTVPIDHQYAQFFEEDMADQGAEVTYRLISLTRVRADAELAKVLNCLPEADVLRLERQRLVRGQAVCLEQRYFSPSLRPDFPTSALETEATYRLVERHLGHRIARLEVALQACIADETLAANLGTMLGRPVMLREHVFVGDDATPLVWGRSFYAEPFAFRYTAHRPPDAPSKRVPVSRATKHRKRDC
jgi:GntR family transcriptional regulator